MNMTENLLFAFALAQGGEFAFVLFSFASQNNVIPESISSLLILVVAISMILTPLMFIIYEKFFQNRFRKEVEEEEDEIDESNDVIIAGFGRFGQILGRLLHGHGVVTTVLDHDASQIDMVRKFGYKVFYGDASRIDLLESAGADKAKLFIIAVDDKDKALEIAKNVKKHFPNLNILSRSYDRRHTYELMRLGIKHIKRETFASSLELGVEALTLLGYSAYQAQRAALTFKHHDNQILNDLFEHYGDEKKFVFYSKQRNDDLLNLLMSEEEDKEDLTDENAWERPSENPTTE